MKIPHMVLALTTLLALPLAAQNPYTVLDDTWISVSGTVDSVSADRFVLDYGQTGVVGEGRITVEMDDGDRDADAYQLATGDTVTVNGWIDDDVFERRTIEASAVRVHNLDTWFYSSGLDEEEIFVPVTEPVIAEVVVRGTVTSVSDDEFTLSSGLRQITVEVEEMDNNPLDQDGYQRLQIGDEVAVTGHIDYDFLEGRDLVASSVITLRR